MWIAAGMCPACHSSGRRTSSTRGGSGSASRARSSSALICSTRASGQTGAVPFQNPPGEVACDILQSDSRKPGSRLADRFFIFGQENERRPGSDQRTGPGGELPAQPDIERSRNVGRSVLGRRARIKNRKALISLPLHLLRRQRRWGWATARAEVDPSDSSRRPV